MKETDLIGEEPRGGYAWEIRNYIEGGAGLQFYLISRYIDFKDHYFTLNNPGNQAIKAGILSWDKPGSGFRFNLMVEKCRG